MYSLEDLAKASIFGMNFILSMLRDGDIVPDENGMFDDVAKRKVMSEELKNLA